MCVPVFARQPTITARLWVFGAKDAPARVTVLGGVHVDRGLPYRVVIARSDGKDGTDLVRSRFFVVTERRVVEERFALATFGAGADGDDKVAHGYRCPRR